MRIKHAGALCGALVTAAAVQLMFSGDLLSRDSITDPQVNGGVALSSTGRGTAAELEANYREWSKEYERGGGDRNLMLPVGAFKGLITEHTDGHGYARFDLVDGVVSAEFRDLPANGTWDLWIMEDKVGTALPDPGDKLIRVGALEARGDAVGLDAKLGAEAFAAFDLTYVIVTHAGKHPSEDRVLLGTTTLFHALYRSEKQGHFGIIGTPPVGEAAARDKSLMMAVADMLVAPANADLGPIPNPTSALQQMITRGRNTFFNETFQGNGRTCGTCHREDESLAISTDFIADLPPDDPLFVAEFLPALARNFENPVLMRRFGLILENVDGFDNLQTKFVMRGIPHTLALNANTLRPAIVDGTQGQFAGPPGPNTPIIPGTDPSIRERTGWGGDGAPGTGTLREFLTGAITQHYPKTLGRVPGRDFRLATNQELLDTEAFMRSTGRRKDLNLGGLLAQNPGDPLLRLKDTSAANGQRIFTNPGIVPGIIPGNTNRGAGKCFLCHSGAGAGETIEQLLFQQPSALGNANFATGVQDLPSLPADLAGQPNPKDQGFGKAPNPAGGFGDGSFNVPVLVEAADTGGFFHNNAVDTIEAAVAFYQGPTFNESPAGQLAGGIELDATEVDQVAKFLRVVNALENLNSTLDLVRRARSTNFNTSRELLLIALAELDDSFDVLRGGNLHRDARRDILIALGSTAQASVTLNPGIRTALIDQAINASNRAIQDMKM